MKLPRNVSGEQLADHLCRRWDYVRVTQVGSHIMLRTETPSHSRQVIPAHRPIKIGTFSKILSQVAAHKQVSREEILRGL
jgi:predicted RNA binding protein YcfA (HicA-like mRNA interferase family)